MTGTPPLFRMLELSLRDWEEYATIMEGSERFERSNEYSSDVEYNGGE